jgi:hypothetical protein
MDAGAVEKLFAQPALDTVLSAGWQTVSYRQNTELHAEACGHARYPRPSGEPGGSFDAVGRPASAILCGDFNFKPEDPEFGRMIPDEFIGRSLSRNEASDLLRLLRDGLMKVRHKAKTA